MNSTNFNMMQQNAPHQQDPQRWQRFVINYYRSTQSPPGSWQSEYPTEHRIKVASHLTSQFRLAKPEFDVVQAARWAVAFETDRFTKSKTPSEYTEAWKSQMGILYQERQRQANAMLQQTTNNNMRMAMMGQTPMQPSGSNQGQQFPQGFPPQLQHQMQASPVNGPGMEGSMQPQQQQNVQRPTGPLPQLTQEEQQQVAFLTQRAIANSSPEQLQKIQNEVAKLPRETLAAMERKGVNPLQMHFRPMAVRAVLAKRHQQQAKPGDGGTMQQQNGLPPRPNQQLPNAQGNGVPSNDITQHARKQQADALQVQGEGQLVVPASHNTTAMPGFGNLQVPQGGQPALNPAILAQRQQQQALNAQQQAQLRANQAQQAAAQAQAQQRQQQQQMGLQGQVGGLYMQPGPQQSPAMPTLTRPMQPPGQNGNTPQQRPQTHTPPMIPAGQQHSQQQMMQAQAAMQQAQQRAAVAQMPMSNAQYRLSMLPSTLTDQQRQHMLAIPQDKFDQFITQIRHANGQATYQGLPMQMPQGGPPMGQQGLQVGQPNPILGGSQGLQSGQQMANGRNPQQIDLQGRQQQQLLAKQRFLSSPQLIAHFDQRPLLPQLLPHIAQMLGQKGVPEQVKTWGQLKQWANSIQPPPPGYNAMKLTQVQSMHYLHLLEAQSNANRPLPISGQMPPSRPGGPAPQAQMVPPNMVQQPQGQVGPQNMVGNLEMPQPPTPGDIQSFRNRFPQHGHLSDENIRSFIMQRRLQSFKNQQTAQMVAQQQQQQQQRRQGSQVQQVPDGHQAQLPEAGQLERVNQTPVQPAAATKPVKPGQQAEKEAQASGAAAPHSQPTKSNKRPNEDGEVGQDLATAVTNVQQSTSVPKAVLSSEQVSRLTPQEQAAYLQRLQLMKAPGQGKMAPLPNSAQIATQMKGHPEGSAQQVAVENRRRLLYNEIDAATPRGAPIPLNLETRQQMQMQTQANLSLLNKVDKAISVALTTPSNFTEEFMKRVIKSRILVFRQLNSDRTLVEDITLSPAEFRENLSQLAAFCQYVVKLVQEKQAHGKVINKKPEQAAPETGGTQPLNAANLQALRQQSQQNLKTRQNPSVAPSTANAPFPLGASSPSGTPIYSGPAQVTTDKLKIPPKKKQKMGHGGSATQTPVQGTPTSSSSPHISKAASPEMKKQPPPEAQKPPVETFKCTHADCDFSYRGFSTKAELEKHLVDRHAPITDPVAYVLEAAAEGLGLNKDGSTKAPKLDANAVNRIQKPSTTSKTGAQSQKSAQATPGAKAEAPTPAGVTSTPMARVATQNSALKSSPSAAMLKTPQTGIKTQTPGTGSGARGTPMKATKESLAAPEQPAPDPAFDSWQDAALSPVVLSGIAEYADHADSMDAFTAVPADEAARWDLPRLNTPTTTPSSDNSPATRSSDISENCKLDVTMTLNFDDTWMGDASILAPDPYLLKDLDQMGVYEKYSLDSDIHKDQEKADFDELFANSILG